MPELPDITVYIERLRPRVEGQVLEKAEIVSPFLLRTFDPPIRELHGRRVNGLLRLGKRIVWCFDDELFLVMHLMIAGRLHWKPPGAKLPGKIGLAAFRFATGTLTLTEAGTQAAGIPACGPRPGGARPARSGRPGSVRRPTWTRFARR